MDNIHKRGHHSPVDTVLGWTTFPKGGHYSLVNNVLGGTTFTKRGDNIHVPGDIPKGGHLTLWQRIIKWKAVTHVAMPYHEYAYWNANGTTNLHKMMLLALNKDLDYYTMARLWILVPQILEGGFVRTQWTPPPPRTGLVKHCLALTH